MSIQLPDSIATFFEMSNGGDTSLLRSCLDEQAAVRDEGKVHRGHEAIQAWLMEARRKYAYTVEPEDATEDGATVHVRARVAGSFPGSPIQLTYTFVLTNNKIASLEIH
ncbi:hypothetical protein LMG31506_01397 [Cupriavidus yeoncheonensis]|uniref:SnoaL-like domain-containing protein n=1 Tax=Cupriavidus yeoncheonensis TaxID=1462994 RepID=A0A916IRL7_9BURK|nr:nuclear transport factor 2 family protein [Cupriavidus yeoncheonensis]CAG2134515.1 hypothetical protein LMG31506_01397 [Cupriavidus yeoncheonensis]